MCSFRALGLVLAVYLALLTCLVAELPSSNILMALPLLYIIVHFVNACHPPPAVYCPLSSSFIGNEGS